VRTLYNGRLAAREGAGAAGPRGREPRDVGPVAAPR